MFSLNHHEIYSQYLVDIFIYICVQLYYVKFKWYITKQRSSQGNEHAKFNE